MFVPDKIRKCVVFIGHELATGNTQLDGTAFIVCRRAFEDKDVMFAYLVTAKHLIDKIRDANCSSVSIRFNFKDGKARWRAVPISEWIFHPDGEEVDVAVFDLNNFGEQPSLDQICFPLTSIASAEVIQAEKIGLGDEVVIAGLFAPHHGENRNIPIIRIGTLAAVPEEKIVTEFGLIDAYLIEARSIGGISGSPVFVNTGYSRQTEEGFVTRSGSPVYLLGLMHGHWKEPTEGVNMGIGIVVPSSKILEVLDQDTIKKREQQMRKAFPTGPAEPL
jgi:hypothetical protein